MYSLRENILKNGSHERKSLIIEFQNPKMNIVGEFLMADASMLNFEVLNLIEHVLSGEKQQAYMTGNRCSLTIKSDQTLIEDAFAGMDGVTAYTSYEMSTTLLQDLILMWRAELQKTT